jgi:Na+/proline symporter
MTHSPFAATGQTPLGYWDPLIDANGDSVTLVFLLSTAGRGLGNFGALRVLQRFLAIESEEKIPVSRNIATLWVMLMFLLGLLL